MDLTWWHQSWEKLISLVCQTEVFNYLGNVNASVIPLQQLLRHRLQSDYWKTILSPYLNLQVCCNTCANSSGHWKLSANYSASWFFWFVEMYVKFIGYLETWYVFTVEVYILNKQTFLIKPSLSISKSGIQLYFPRSNWTLGLTSIKKWLLHSSVMLANAIGKCIPC